MKPLKVAVLATSVGRDGGVQRYGTMVLRSLSAEGHSPVVRESIAWPTPADRVRGMARFGLALGDVDLLWVLHPRLALAGAGVARPRRLPMVVSTYGFENWGAYSRAARFALGRADVVTAISVFSASLMGEPGRGAVLLRPTWGIPAGADAPPPESPSRRSVLFVGRLSEAYKGTDVVLELASRLRVDERWTFVLAGDGRLPAPLQKRAETLPNVRVVGSPSDADLVALYAGAAVLLVPTRTQRLAGNRWTGGEGFGIVILEAAVAGVPVLASDEGACPETVALLGHGFVRRPTADDFEPVLRELLADARLRAELALRGVTMSKTLSPAAFQEGVASVLELALAGRASP